MKVVHCKKEPFDVYIGRPSIWGNLWSHKEDSQAEFKTETREEAVENYRKWLMEEDFFDVYPERRRKILKELQTLNNKILGCWCYPKLCHGDVLIQILRDIKNITPDWFDL